MDNSIKVAIIGFIGLIGAALIMVLPIFIQILDPTLGPTLDPTHDPIHDPTAIPAKIVNACS